MKRLILNACLVAIWGCQNGSVKNSTGPSYTVHSELARNREGNPKRPQLPGSEPLVRTGTDANNEFVEASSFCPGSQASVFVRFKNVEVWTSGIIAVENVSKNRLLELYKYNIPPKTDMFDFAEFEAALSKWFGLRDNYVPGDQLQIVARQFRNNAQRELVFETEKVPFELIDAQLKLEEVSMRQPSDDERQFVAKMSVTPKTSPKTTGAYRCLMRSDMGAYLKLSGEAAAGEAPLALFVRPAENTAAPLFMTGGVSAEIPMSLQTARDVEPYLRAPALMAKWVKPDPKTDELILSEEVTVKP